ncbi:MAG TPA: hypothetical protein VK186_01440 [Candidatus Deferrimicrobium sp.]|nr:hypothetical protein [Candidatus Deferrimicrobium sp.]
MNKSVRVTFISLFVSVCFLLSISSNLEGQQQKRMRFLNKFGMLAAPVQVSPVDNSHFTNYPRTVNLNWNPVPGAAWYDVEIDCLHCRVSGQWDSQNGPAWKTESNLTSPGYSFVFVGDNQGRWRVRAANSSQTGPWSPWWNFDFNTSAAGLNPPIQVFPVNNIHFTHYPRVVGLIWEPVSGAAWYDVEIDCLHCRVSGQWDSDNGPAWKIQSNLTSPFYNFVFVGDNQGRWRVRAANSSQTSPWSPWWNFDFNTAPGQ